MSDKHPEIECYECGRLKTRIIWQGRCVTCAVQRLEFNLEENDTLRSENAAIKEENERLSDGLSHHMNISQVLADGNANMHEMVMERDAEIELLKARVAELEKNNFRSGLIAAAVVIENKVAEYDYEHGITEPDTGCRVYPGRGEDYVYSMIELAEELRMIADKEPANEG